MSKIIEEFWPAPLKGLDWRQSFSSGPSDTASVLDSVVVTEHHIERAQSASVFAAFGGALQLTVHNYNGSPIYAVNNLLGVGAAMLPNTAITNTQVYSTTFATGAGTFFIGCNGTDIPKTYNGAAWANLAVTGPTLTNIFQAIGYRRRLYLLDKTALGFWYLNPDAIAGAATFYSVGSLVRNGGAAVALAVMSRDGGAGPDDLLILYTSQGEIVVFSGNDPAASTWTPLGVYRIGEPASLSQPNPDIMTNMGGDVLAHTIRGVMPVSEILKGLPPSYHMSVSAPIDIGLFYTQTNLAQYFIKYVTNIGIFLSMGNNADGELFFRSDKANAWSRLWSPNQIVGTNVNTYKGMWNLAQIGISAIGGFMGGSSRIMLAGQVSERWVIRHMPRRMKSIRDFRVCEYRPIITADQNTFYAIQPGIAYNLSDVFVPNLMLKPQNQWVNAGTIPATNPATTNASMVSRGWMTPNSDSGFCATLQLAGDPTTNWPNVKYFGTDVRIEELGING